MSRLLTYSIIMQQRRKGAGFKTEWTVSGDATARTITLPLYNSGTFDCTVKWGDGSADSVITAYNHADRIHTYASDGTYEVEITGECPAWSFNGAGDVLKLTDIIYWGDSSKFGGFRYLSNGFFGCINCKSLGNSKILSKSGLTQLYRTFRGMTNSNLTSIPSGLFDNCIYLSSFGFYQTFYGCSKLTSIPTDLFRYNTAVSVNGFESTFENCSGLTSIPTDLFRYNTSLLLAGFNRTFYGCSGLTGAIPTDLFRYNTAVSSNAFNSTFRGCSKLTSIPTDLFRYNTDVSTYGFSNTFYGCSKLTSIPTDLFRYNTAVSSNAFNSTFYGCSGLTGAIPTDLFRYNTAVSASGFYQTFYGCGGLTGAIPTDLFRYNINASGAAFQRMFMGCSGLTSAPTDLFRYNTAVSGAAFTETFNGCIKLQLNRNVFFADGEESTRFLNITISFFRCFTRGSFSGTKGEAPKLWDCDFGTGTVTKTECYSGDGNSLTSLSNYADIPEEWK